MSFQPESLINNPLFEKFSFNQLKSILNCIDAKVVSYKKNNFILEENQTLESIGIVLTGTVQNIRVDIHGNVNLIAKLGEGDIFGEAIVCASPAFHNITVLAECDCEILYLNYKKILSVCSCACSFHMQLIKNMLKIMAQKNLFLNDKLEHVTKRTTREKLLSYLFFVSKQMQKKEFEIPFDRKQLADYLSVERSAMSAELSKLKEDGILDFHKNHFKLLLENKKSGYRP